MKSIEIRNLDDSLNPMKVGDFTLPIEIANNDIRINAETEFTKDVTTNSDINLIGDSSDIVFNKNVRLEARSTDNHLSLFADQFMLNTTSYASGNSSQIRIASATDTDQTITFMEGATVQFGIGNDGSEATPTFKVVGVDGVMGTNDLLSITTDGDITNARDFESGRDVTVGRTLNMNDSRRINFGTGNDFIYGDSDAIYVARNNTQIMQFKDTDVMSDKPVAIKEQALSPLSADAGYGKFWVKNTTPCDLYFQTDAGDDIQITDGTSMAGGGGGTDTWSKTLGGYKVNNNSSSFYYFQSYPTYHVWTNADSSPTGLSFGHAIRGSFWTADKDGAVTNIRVHMYATDTGATDPLKFYCYKYTLSNGAGSASGSLIATTDAITPTASKIMVASKDFSSSNTFSEGDALLIAVKKDSTSGNQDQYFNVTVSGTYS